MATVLYDGDYSEAVVAGQTEFEIPFASDPKPYIYKVPFWQLSTGFIEPDIGEPGPLGGSYIGISAGSIKTIGGGIVEFNREFAILPDSRSEYESFVYSYQIILIGGSGGITEMPITVSSRIQFDYFETDTPGSIDLPRAGKAFEVANVIYMLNGFCDTVLDGVDGQEVQAQDATMKRWKGNIYERQIRYIPWYSIDTLFANSGCGA